MSRLGLVLGVQLILLLTPQKSKHLEYAAPSPLPTMMMTMMYSMKLSPRQVDLL